MARSCPEVSWVTSIYVITKRSHRNDYQLQLIATP